MSEESPVTCEGCGKPFASITALARHQVERDKITPKDHPAKMPPLE
jgi:hypothetical protein